MEGYLICIASDMKGYLVAARNRFGIAILSIECFPKKGVPKPDSWRTPVNYCSCQWVMGSIPTTDHDTLGLKLDGNSYFNLWHTISALHCRIGSPVYDAFAGAR